MGRFMNVEESSKLFISQGYSKTTIRQIAEVCGLGRGHLYYYFKKKEDILLYLYKDLLDKLYIYINKNYNFYGNSLLKYRRYSKEYYKNKIIFIRFRRYPSK